MYDNHWWDQVERWTTGHCEGAITVGVRMYLCSMVLIDQNCTWGNFSRDPVIVRLQVLKN